MCILVGAFSLPYHLPPIPLLALGLTVHLKSGPRSLNLTYRGLITSENPAL